MSLFSSTFSLIAINLPWKLFSLSINRQSSMKINKQNKSKLLLIYKTGTLKSLSSALILISMHIHNLWIHPYCRWSMKMEINFIWMNAEELLINILIDKLYCCKNSIAINLIHLNIRIEFHRTREPTYKY